MGVGACRRRLVLYVDRSGDREIRCGGLPVCLTESVCLSVLPMACEVRRVCRMSQRVTHTQAACGSRAARRYPERARGGGCVPA